MPRYYFTVVYSDHMVVGDPSGTEFPDEASAIIAARRIFDGLQQARLPDAPYPNPTIIVMNDEREVVYRFPSN